MIDAAARRDRDLELATIDEVVRLLRVKSCTVYRLVRSGDLPAVRIGRQWRVRRSDLDRWIEERRFAASAIDSTATQPQLSAIERRTA